MALAALLVLDGCGSATDATAPTGANTTPSAPGTTRTAVAISSTPDANATGVAPGSPVVIDSAHGTIRKVEVTAPDSSLTGAADPGGTHWTSATSPEPNATYKVHVVVADEHGNTDDRDWSFATGAPTTVFKARLSPDGKTVGTGIPIIVTTSQPVSEKQRAAFEARLTVTPEPAVQGGWHWFSPTELHWRPALPWPPHTSVKVDEHLEHFDAGNGAWGVNDVHTQFTIGDSHVSVVDVATHTMTVYSNNVVVKTIPVSTGRDKYPTKGGTHVISEKAKSVVMDSSSVGIPRNSPDGYYETVNWSLRISNSGEFVHAAPWSTGSQGNSNVSHGCVNVSDADGQWFFNFSEVGDIVQVNGSPTPLEPTNGYGDWQVPWSSWPN